MPQTEDLEALARRIVAALKKQAQQDGPAPYVDADRGAGRILLDGEFDLMQLARDIGLSPPKEASPCPR
ncbi:hypothetical protein BKE38_12605 [Pseudoroseomonas deserti]|uniref:Uncharacterized protein n=1 Tax=Teichococcus deserti TaxID=1817963 RepID=A0A1V2H239_9PROT|nr:hypothetical protein [Pseudoroseomonas deserti]ONG53296.1 hypothetical protein BKE38_12605 [Pseudoroseomonas deserti]